MNMAARGSDAGFTLLEVVLVIAVLAVLAGIMAPYTAGQINAAKRDATARELETIASGLSSHYRDCGSLPTTASGLTALVRNIEGLANWRGPYVGGGGDIEAGIVADAWGELYTYVRAPTVQGMASAPDYIVLSPGVDRVLNSASGAGGWTLDPNQDIILQGVTQSTDDDWRERTTDLLDAIEDALMQYYGDVGAFPAGTDSTAIAELLTSGTGGWQGPYLTGTARQVVRDPWNNTLMLRSCTQVNGEIAAGRILISRGPGAPDPTAVGQAWTTGANDLYRVVPEAPLIARRNLKLRERAARELRLLTGEIYVAHPSGSPASGALADLDPWGRPYRYQMHTALSGVVYSVGADGVDEGGNDDDPAEALLWQP